MTAIILSLLIFLIMGITASLLILNTQSQRRTHMMRVVQGSDYSVNKKANKTVSRDQKRFDLANKLQDEEKEAKKKNASISDLIMQAGLETPVKKFWIYSSIFAVLMTLLAVVIGLSKFLIVMLSIISFFGLPKLFLKFKAKRRQKKFMEDFADALESMMRLLKAGMPVSEAIKMVAREFTGPMGDEMGRVYDQQKIGVPLPEAVAASARRMPLPEMQMFATAIAIQTQTGASLSEVLSNLAGVIRSRFKLKRKIQTMSAEAKISAAIIGALPVVVTLALYAVNREYIQLLFDEPTGRFMLGCAVTWMLLGCLVMRQMINFKV